MSQQISSIKRITKNKEGRDLCVGDVHGNFSGLQAALISIGFNPEKDRLFSVGDLVDRGAESHLVLDWLAKPWFHAAIGNHEDMAVRFVKTGLDASIYLANGGAWFVGMPKNEQESYASAFSLLPVAMEVETESGLVGIVHADCPTETWGAFREALEHQDRYPPASIFSIDVKDYCLWSRVRIQTESRAGVPDVRAVIVGHTPLRDPVCLGSVFYIDTMGWLPQKGGRFTILDLHTLEPVAPVS